VAEDEVADVVVVLEGLYGFLQGFYALHLLLFVVEVAHAVEVAFYDEYAAFFIVVNALVYERKGGKVFFYPVYGFPGFGVVIAGSGVGGASAVGAGGEVAEAGAEAKLFYEFPQP